jgi:hypothetical protein
LWEPFTDDSLRFYSVTRNIYKNLRQQDHFRRDQSLRLALFQVWLVQQRKVGFVKESTLKSITDKPVEVDLLDGLQNILPYGVSYFQNEYSNLADAYKKNEKAEDTTGAVYAQRHSG